MKPGSCPHGQGVWRWFPWKPCPGYTRALTHQWCIQYEWRICSGSGVNLSSYQEQLQESSSRGSFLPPSLPLPLAGSGIQDFPSLPSSQSTCFALPETTSSSSSRSWPRCHLPREAQWLLILPQSFLVRQCLTQHHCLLPPPSSPL